MYALEIFSHRLLRYASPALNLVAFVTSAVLASQRSSLYSAMLTAQIGVLAIAAGSPTLEASATNAEPIVRVARLLRYYVLVTAAPAAGLWDYLREGTPTQWGRAEDAR